VSWILVSLGSAAVTALVSISDKTVIHRYARSPMTLPLLIGFAQTSVGIFVLSLTGFPNNVTLTGSLYALLSGVFFGFSGVVSQRVLFTQEVSRTIPVTQASPIFAALLSMVALGESISLVQWSGIMATVFGSAAISFGMGGGGNSILGSRYFYILMFSALLFGIANVVGKAALNELPVLYTHGLRMLALGLVFLSTNLRPEPWEDVKGYFLHRSPALVVVAVNEFITANIGLLLLLWALSLGPVSLVTAVVSSRALFVVIYSIGLATIWRGALGEQISARIVVIKVISAGLIVGGIVVIGL